VSTSHSGPSGSHSSKALVISVCVVHNVEVVASRGGDHRVGVLLRLEWADVHCGGVECGTAG
jgi:hypothetical protein